jgi:hypothetical protein
MKIIKHDTTNFDVLSKLVPYNPPELTKDQIKYFKDLDIARDEAARKMANRAKNICWM